jgi:hypothetical protein
MIAAKRVAGETHRKNTVCYLQTPRSGIKLSVDPVIHFRMEVERRFLPLILGLQRRLATGKEGLQVRRSGYFQIEKEGDQRLARGGFVTAPRSERLNVPSHDRELRSMGAGSAKPASSEGVPLVSALQRAIGVPRRETRS